eukprot:gene2465-3239_t
MAIRSGQPVIVQDIRTEGDFADWTERMLGHGFHGVICLPLQHRDQDRAFGLLYLYAPDILQISPEEAALLQELASDLAFGITSLRAHKAQQRLQASVLKVAAAVSASTGTEFFVQLVRNMADALDAQGGCVVRLLPATAQGQAPRVVTLAAVLDGQMLPNDEYTLARPRAIGLCSSWVHATSRAARAPPSRSHSPSLVTGASPSPKRCSPTASTTPWTRRCARASAHS